MSLQLDAEEQAVAVVRTYFEGLRDRRRPRLSEAEAALAAEQDKLAAFERDGTVPAPAAQLLSIRVADAVTEASSEVVFGQADRSVFDNAKAVREAVHQWLRSIDALPDQSNGHGGDAAAGDADGQIGQRMMAEHLRAGVTDAEIKADKERDDLAQLETTIQRLSVDRVVPASHVEDLWTHVRFDVADTAANFLEGRVNAAAVEEAIAVRDMVQNWLQDQGHSIDTSRFMAGFPRR